MRKVIISFVTLLLMCMLVGCQDGKKETSDVKPSEETVVRDFDYSKFPLLSYPPIEEKPKDKIINPFTFPLEKKELPEQISFKDFTNNTNLILERYEKGELKFEKTDEERTVIIPVIEKSNEKSVKEIIDEYNELHKDDISCGLSFDLPRSEKEKQDSSCESSLLIQTSESDETVGQVEKLHEEVNNTFKATSNELRHPGETNFRKITNEETFHVIETNEYMYTVVNCNVRDYPGTMGTSKYLLYKYSPVLISGICDNGWYQIKNGDELLYAPSEFFSYQDPVFINRDVTCGYNYSFLYNDGVDDEYIKIVEDGLAKVPKDVIDEFESNGWKMFVSDRNITDMFWDGSSILAITLSDRHEIWISTRNQDPNTVVHEFGHYLDGMYREKSSTDEFVNIFYDELKCLASIDDTCEVNYNTPSEYFAEAYKLSIVNEKSLLTYCPKTTDYMICCLAE